MNKIFLPPAGSYLVFTSPINQFLQKHSRPQMRWYLRSPPEDVAKYLNDHAVHYNGLNTIDIQARPGDWYLVNQIFAPRKSWHTWEGYCIIGLRIEMNKKDRKIIKDYITSLCLTSIARILPPELHKPWQFNFSLYTRNIELSSKDINEKCICKPTREEAIALSNKIRGEKDKPLATRWQHLET